MLLFEHGIKNRDVDHESFLAFMCILKNIDRKPYRASENGNQSTIPLFKISGFLIESVSLSGLIVRGLCLYAMYARASFFPIGSSFVQWLARKRAGGDPSG